MTETLAPQGLVQPYDRRPAVAGNVLSTLSWPGFIDVLSADLEARFGDRPRQWMGVVDNVIAYYQNEINSAPSVEQALAARSEGEELLFRRNLMANVKLPKGTPLRILDLGVGPGKMIPWLEEEGYTIEAMHGVDVMKLFVDTARARYGNRSNFTFAVDNVVNPAVAFPFRPNLITCMGVLGHRMPEFDNYIAYMLRMMASLTSAYAVANIPTELDLVNSSAYANHEQIGEISYIRPRVVYSALRQLQTDLGIDFHLNPQRIFPDAVDTFVTIKR